MHTKPLLVIEPFSFLPIDSGGKNRIYHTIEQLSKYFRLHLITFYTNTKEQETTRQHLDAKNITNQSFKVRSKYLFSFLKNGIPYWFSDWYNPELIKTLSSFDDDHYEAVSVEFTQLLYTVNALPKTISKSFTAHDIASISFWRRLKAESNILKKGAGLFRWLEVYVYERKFLPKFDRVIAVSGHDADVLKRHFKVKQVEVIPNGISEIDFLPPREKDNHINIGFIGSFSHPPNLQAFHFIVDHIVPELMKQEIKYRLLLAGNNSSLDDYPGIQNLGYVKDVKNFYKQIDILVVPIFAGSGTRIKILESLSFARPVLTTKVGAEGIHLDTPYLQILPSEQEKDARRWVQGLQNIQKSFQPANIKTQNLAEELSKLTWKSLFTRYTP